MSTRDRIGNGVKSELSKERVIDRLKGLQNYLSSLPKRVLFEYTLLGIIVILSISLRLLPLRWGVFLSEFDPYQHYRMAQYILDNGFSSWFSWFDNMSWYPWGRDIPTSNYPGVAFTATITYQFVRSIGVDLTLMQWCIFFPVVFGSLTCIAAYLLGKEIGGGSVGLFTALFMAFSSAHISRTSLGFFDDETIGIFLMLLFFAFFLKASRSVKNVRGSVVYSIMAGLSLAFLASSWGAFRYPAALIALYVLILILVNKGSRNLLISYGVTFGIAWAAMAQIPNLGYIFLQEWTSLAIGAIFLILAVSEGYKIIQPKFGKTSLLLLMIIIIVGGGLVLLYTGQIENLSIKFTSVLNPSLKTAIPIVESVAEHRPGTWASFFYEFGPMIFLGIFGFYFAARRGNPNDIFLILFGVSSVYFASSFVRLTLIMAPAFAILPAVAVEGIAQPSLDILKEKLTFPKRRVKAIARVGKEYGVASILILMIALVPSFYYATQSAYMPATIATSSIGILPTGDDELKYQDWLHALVWMKDNLPENAVVMSWWDYGYWITAIAERRSMADNGTINATQVATIACLFLSNETWAIPVMKRYNISHIAIFVTWYPSEEGTVNWLGAGEDNKWYWMTRIGNGTTIGDITYTFQQKRMENEVNYHRLISSKNELLANDTIAGASGIGQSALLGKMMYMGISPGGAEGSDYFENVFASSNRFVLVFEVLYLEEAMLFCEVTPTSVVYGDTVTAVGRLTNASGTPLPEKEVVLESRLEGIGEWSEITKVTTDSDGTYKVSWDPPVSILEIRARWPGEKGLYVDAVSPVNRLLVNRTDATVACKLSNSSLQLGDDVEILVELSPRIEEGNVTLEYRVEGEEWTPLKIGKLTNGTFLTTWTPEVTGFLKVRAIWSGSYNMNPATSIPVDLEVKEKPMKEN